MIKDGAGGEAVGSRRRQQPGFRFEAMPPAGEPRARTRPVLLVGTFLLLSATFTSTARAQDAALDARLTSFECKVTVYTADDPDGSEPVQDMPLEAGDKIVTGTKGRAEFSLDGESVVELGPNTEFTIGSLERRSAAFDLGLGSLLAKIKSGLFGDGGELQVRTASAVAAVRGTEFGVENSAEEGAHFGVFDEGKVAVKGASGGEVLLTPNQETSVLRGQRPQAARALRRFAAHRRRMIAVRRRIAVVRRNWRKLPAAKRQALRQKFVERRRALRERGINERAPNRRKLEKDRKKSLREILEDRRKRKER